MITLTRQVQRALHVHSRRLPTPGSCLITSLPQDVAGSKGNKFGASSIAVVPTMRYPSKLNGTRISSIMRCGTCWPKSRDGALSRAWTREELVREDRASIDDGLATGCGNVSAERCAQQMMLAVRHFAQGVPESANWTGRRGLISVCRCYCESVNFSDISLTCRDYDCRYSSIYFLFFYVL